MFHSKSLSCMARPGRSIDVERIGRRRRRGC